MKPSDFATSIYDLFPPFRQWDDVTLEAWTNAIVRESGAFSPAVREKAFASLVRSKQKEKPPQVGTVVAHCAEAHRWLEMQKKTEAMPLEQQQDSRRDFTSERVSLAWQLACNPNDPICKAAAREGWIGVLHQFVRMHQRMPSATQKTTYRKTKDAADETVTELEWCKREAKDVDAAYKASLMNQTPLGKMLQEMGAEMLRKRKAKEDFVLHGVCP